MVEALSTHDYPALLDLLEGRLYHKVEGALRDLEFSNTRLKSTSNLRFSVSLHNMQFFMGVHTQRVKNLPLEDYDNVLCLETLKQGIDREQFSKEAREKGISEGFNLLDMDLTNIWAYLSPRAPAKLVVSVDVLFTGLNPLTIVSFPSSEPLLPSTSHTEHHLLRFECTATNVGLQGDYAERALLAMIKPLVARDVTFQKAAWTVVDIDEGENPHVVSRNKR